MFFGSSIYDLIKNDFQFDYLNLVIIEIIKETLETVIPESRVF